MRGDTSGFLICGFLLLQGSESRLSPVIDRNIPKAAVAQESPGHIKAIANCLRGVAVRSKGDELTAKLTVASQNIPRGVGMSQMIAKACGITFQGLSLLYQCL